MNLTPKQLFLVDGVGALVTAGMLGLVLTKFESNFGVPTAILYPLSAVALLFCIYSIANYFMIGMKWRVFLKLIAIANSVYCLITLSVILLIYDSLTWLGLAYFLSEIIIVMTLVSIEWKKATTS